MLGSGMAGLDFIPLAPSPKLFPLCKWRGLALNHFTAREAFYTQDLSDVELAQALLQIYPHLTFPELARLQKCLASENLSEHFESIVTVYGFGYDQRLLQAFEIYHSLSDSMQTWVERHSLAPRDLMPLAALDKIPHEALHLLPTADISRNYGAQIIELIVENILLEQPLSAILPAKELTQSTTPAWVEQLKKLRFPETQRLDEAKQAKLAALPWTKDIQTRWHRKGDQSGLEVRFTVSSKKDLETKLETLERVLEKYND